MAHDRVVLRAASHSRLPFPKRGPKANDPSNADILRALEEVKANQQKLLDERNKIKAHILFIDRLCLKIFIDSDDLASSGILGLFYNHSGEQQYLELYHNLPPL